MAIYSVQANHVLISQGSDISRDISLASGALADFAGDFWSEWSVLGSSHQFKGCAHLASRNYIQERGLAQRDAEGLLEGVIEDGIAGGVGEVG